MAKKTTTILGGPYDDADDGGDLFGPTTGDAAILMREFGIDPAGPLVPRWVALAQALAENYHPDYKAPVGRPKHKLRPYFAMLLGSVEDVMQRKNLRSQRSALKWAYENCPGILVGSHRENKIPTLETLYADVKTANSMKRNGRLW